MIDHPDAGGPHFDTDLVQNGKLARLHKGGGGAQETKQDKQNKLLQEQLMKAQLKQIKDYKEPEMPEWPKVEAPAPSPGETPTDVAQAEADARRQAARRRGLQRTIFSKMSDIVPQLGGRKTILG